MKLMMRKYQNIDDLWKIRDFLREVFLLNDREEWSWQTLRLDYWYGRIDLGRDEPEDILFIWENEAKQIKASLTIDGKAQAYLQIHPNYRSAELMQEMIVVAEQNLYGVGKESKRRFINIWVHEPDEIRQDILTRRGYKREDNPEEQAHKFRCLLDRDLPEISLPEGFTVRAIGDGQIDPQDWKGRSWAWWRGFHSEEALGNYDGKWERTIKMYMSMPMYRRDLDIVVIDPNGKVAASCILWFDDVTGMGQFEPVAVMPKYHRQGLGKAMMLKGMHTIKIMGATMVGVHGFSVAATGLYSSLMGEEYAVGVPWTKIFD